MKDNQHINLLYYLTAFMNKEEESQMYFPAKPIMPGGAPLPKDETTKLQQEMEGYLMLIEQMEERAISGNSFYCVTFSVSEIERLVEQIKEHKVIMWKLSLKTTFLINLSQTLPTSYLGHPWYPCHSSQEPYIYCPQ